MTLRVPLFGVGDAYQDVIASTQRRINCYYDRLPEGTEEATFLLKGIPGLVEVTNFGVDPIRGMITKGGFMYIVQSNHLYRMDPSEQVTDVGNIGTSSGYVSMVANTTQLSIMDGTNHYVYDTQIGGISVPSMPYPQPSGNAYIDGQIIGTFGGRNQFAISGIEDAKSWSGDDFASAEYAPDDIIRPWADRGNLVLFGERTIEFWQNTGNGDFPFNRINGSTLDIGLAAKWSVCTFGVEDTATVAFLARSPLAKVYVALLVGGEVKHISSTAIDARINHPSFGSTADAVGFSYSVDGHAMYVLNFPTANTTLVYDGKSGIWHEQQDSEGDRYRGNLGTQFNGKDYVADYENGRLYRLDPNVYTDAGQMQVLEVITPHTRRLGAYVCVDFIEILAEKNVATADGLGADPKILLQVSRDGGYTWGPYHTMKIGKIGDPLLWCRANRLGAGRDLVFKLRITDPVRRALVGAYIQFRGDGGQPNPS